jgi:hypothetical protein
MMVTGIPQTHEHLCQSVTPVALAEQSLWACLKGQALHVVVESLKNKPVTRVIHHFIIKQAIP